MTEEDETEIAWLHKAGRSISFIAVRLQLRKRAVTGYLRALGVIDAPKNRGYTPVSHFKTMNASTVVPPGDPLLQALAKHHPEHDPCRKR